MNRLGYFTHKRLKTEHKLASLAKRKSRLTSTKEREEGAGRKNCGVYIQYLGNLYRLSCMPHKFTKIAYSAPLCFYLNSQLAYYLVRL